MPRVDTQSGIASTPRFLGGRDELRRRRGYGLDIPWRRAEATPRLQRGRSTQVQQFQAHFSVLPGDKFAALDRLQFHEEIRDALVVYDSRAQVLQEIDAGSAFVFLSHQWYQRPSGNLARWS